MTALAFLATVLIWGTTFYAISLQLGDVPAIQSVFYRFATATMVMWFLALPLRIRLRYDAATHRLFAGLGLLLFSLNYVVVYHATAYLISGLVSVIFSLSILFNTALSWLLFHERPSRALLTGAVLGIGGLVALFFHDLYGVSLSPSLLLGMALTLISTLMASSGNIIAQSLKQRGVKVDACNTWGMTYGTLFLLLANMLDGEGWRFSTDMRYIGSLLYLAIPGTVIAFWTYITVIHRIGAPRAAYISVLFPLVALLVSTIYEDMHWSGWKIVGVIMILLGNIFIINLKHTLYKK